MRLIDKQRLETVKERIDVGYPFEPWVHIWAREHKPGVCNECKDKQTSNCHSLGKGLCSGSDRTKNHGHGQGRNEDEKEKSEELGSRHSEPSQEIENYIEANG
jgi:hypothetical protein